MTNIVLVFPSTAENNPEKVFKGYLDVEFDSVYLCSTNKDKILNI